MVIFDGFDFDFFVIYNVWCVYVMIVMFVKGEEGRRDRVLSMLFIDVVKFE